MSRGLGDVYKRQLYMSVVSVRRALDSVASIRGLRFGFRRAFVVCSSEPPLDCRSVLLKKQELEGLHRLADMAGNILFIFQVAGELQLTKHRGGKLDLCA